MRSRRAAPRCSPVPAHPLRPSSDALPLLAVGASGGGWSTVVNLVALDWLWLLLPVAATSGWYAAKRRRPGERRSPAQTELRNHYFRGVNYLLNEQPDKAIELFIRMLEVDSETVDTHLALGNLYRRRGEVDRAIRIHHNLIEGRSLGAEERSEALLELGQDYLSAGLLDRAEDVFQSLAEHPVHGVQALRQLIDIYEQEQDWDQASPARNAWRRPPRGAGRGHRPLLLREGRGTDFRGRARRRAGGGREGARTSSRLRACASPRRGHASHARRTSARARCLPRCRKTGPQLPARSAAQRA